MRERSKLKSHDAGFLHLPSGVISISDAAYFWDFPVEVDFGVPTDLRISVLLDLDEVVREVRMSPEGGQLYETKPIGELQIEFSLVIVCDRVSWDRELGGLSGEEYLAFQDSLDDKWLIDSVPLAGCPDALLFRAAADGYCVYTLSDARARVVGCVIAADSAD